MNKKTVILMASVTVLLFFQIAATPEDETLQEYPDGEYGIDLGEGYEVLPDDEFIAAPGYRDEYLDTEYGPLVDDKFLVFPGFYFGPYKEELPEEMPEYYYIYYEAMTAPEETVEKAPEETVEKVPEKKKKVPAEYIK